MSGKYNVIILSLTKSVAINYFCLGFSFASNKTSVRKLFILILFLLCFPFNGVSKESLI